MQGRPKNSGELIQVKGFAAAGAIMAVTAVEPRPGRPARGESRDSVRNDDQSHRCVRLA